MIKIASRVSGSPDGYRFKSTVEGNGDYKVRVRSRLTNIIILIVSFVLAMSLWIYAANMNKTPVQKTFSAIPVEIRGEGSLHPYIEKEMTVDVKLEGTKKAIDDFDVSNDIKAYVDVSNYETEGYYTSRIRIQVDREKYTVIDQSEYYWSIHLDTLGKKMVDVEARLESKPDGFDGEIDVSEAAYSTSQIEVTGPEYILNAIDKAMLPVNVTGDTNLQAYTNDIILVDRSGTPISDRFAEEYRYVEKSPSSVTADIPVYYTKTVPLRIVWKYNYINDKTAKVTLNPSTIEIKGKKNVLEKISEITIDVDETKIADNTTAPAIPIPEGTVKVSDITNAEITVEYISLTTKMVEVKNLTINNPNGINVELLEDSVNVKLRGETQYMDYVTASQVSATVDLSTFNGESEYADVKVAVSDLYKDHVYAVGTYTIHVRAE